MKMKPKGLIKITDMGPYQIDLVLPIRLFLLTKTHLIVI